MTRFARRTLFLAAMLLLAACAGRDTKNAVQEVVFLQINDVYEIDDMPRVRAVVEAERAKNRDTWVVLAGDFISPSAMGTAIKPDGNALAGEQMIDVLNHVGVDYAVFGNHEFDPKSRDVLDARIREAKFVWLAGNVRDTDGSTYGELPETAVITTTGSQPFTIGVAAATMLVTSRDWARVDPPLAGVQAQLAALAQADVRVAITHQKMQDDRELVATVPGLTLVMGGHEHERIVERAGDRAPIAKADSNARSIARHRLHYDPATRIATVDTDFITVDDSIAPDAEVAARVAHWTAIAAEAFAKDGIDIARPVTTLPHVLDGMRETVRGEPAELGRVIATALLRRCPGAQAAFFSAGTIRIDDMLGPGEITEYDVLRVAPFGDRIVCASAPRDVVTTFLDTYLAKTGTSDYMQLAGIAPGNAGWRFDDGAPLPAGSVRIATIKYVLDNLKLATDAGSASDGGDLRVAIIESMRGDPR